MTTYRAGILLSLICLLYAAWGIGYIERTSLRVDYQVVYTLWDDAMISMRYAENLSNGDGLVWNPGGERIQGYTNLGVTLMMAAAHLVPVEKVYTPLVVQIIQLAMLLAMIVLVWQICQRLFPERARVGIAAVACTVLCAPLGIWGLQGADTAMVTLWLLVAVAAMARVYQQKTRWPLWLWFWIGLGSVIRLDCLLIAGVLTLGSFFYPVAGSQSSSARYLWRMVLGGSVSIAIFAGVMLFSYAYYGDALPNTYYLKSTGTPQDKMFLSGLWAIIRWPGLIIAMVAACYSVFLFRKHVLLLQMASIVLLTVLYTIKIGGDWAAANGVRFIVPVLPLLIILLIATGAESTLLSRWLIRNDRAIMAKQLIAMAPAIVIALALNPLNALNEWFNPKATTMYRSDNTYNAYLGMYYKNHTDPDTSIGVYWAGVTPYFGERRALDLLGKCDAHIARLSVDRFMPGHSKWDSKYTIYQQKPDVLSRLGRELQDNPDVTEHYYSTRTRPSKGQALYVRKESVHKLLEHQYPLTDMETRRPVARTKVQHASR